MQHTVILNNAIVHCSTVDAVFRSLDGRPIAMEFHRFCGPSFAIDGEDFSYMPTEGSKEWDSLWSQFDGWLSANQTPEKAAS